MKINNKGKSIRTKLIWGAVILVSLLLLQGIISQLIIEREHRVINDINSIYERQQELAGAKYYHRGWMQDLETAFVTGDIPGIGHHSECPLGEWLLGLNPDEINGQQIEQLGAAHRNIHSNARQVVTLLEQGNREQALNHFTGAVVSGSQLMENIMAGLTDSYHEQITAQRGRLNFLHRVEIIVLLVLTILLVLGAIYLFYWLDRGITKPLGKIMYGMKEVEEGNLDVDINVDREDELGYLAENFNRMLEPLRLERWSLNILEVLGATADRESLFAEIAAELSRFESVVSVAIYTYNEWEDLLELAHGDSLPGSVSKSLSPERGLMKKIVGDKDIIALDNLDRQWEMDAGIGTIKVDSVTGIPVFYKDKLQAVIMLGSTEELSSGQKDECRRLGSQLGITLNNIKQYESIQKLVNKLERKNRELANQKNYAEAVLRSSAEGIFSIDENKIIKTWSRGAEEITGFKAAEVVGKRCCDFLWPQDKKGNNLCGDDKEDCYFERITAEHDVIRSKEIYYQINKQMSLPCQISVARIYDQQGNPAGSVQVFRDISWEKANMLKIKKANRAKSEFLATMSHELRTPLNSVLGFGDLLQNEVAGELNEKQQRYVSNIIQGGNNLLSLINDILDLSRIESDEIEWEISSIKLENLLKNSLIIVKGKAKNAGINLESDIEEGLDRIEWDESKLKMVVNNLLSNAIKFTPEGGRAGLKARREDDEIIIEVWDTGIGIPPEKQEEIFEPFVQLDSSLSRRYEGTGLGLDLVKKLVEFSGGEIRLESEVDRGSRFIIRIPARVDPAIVKKMERENEEEEITYGSRLPEHNGSKNNVESEPGSILLIDDEPYALEIIEERLAFTGFKVYKAYDGREGLAKARKYHPDAILLDLIMPGMDGFQVIEELQEDPQLRFIPVIILTAKMLTRSEEQFLDNHAAARAKKSRLKQEEFREEVLHIVRK